MAKSYGSLTALGLASSILGCLATPVQAGGFGIGAQSTTGLGMANAGAAAGAGGVASIFWNPATITMRPGRMTEQNYTFVNLSARITPTDGTSPVYAGLGDSGEIGRASIIPSSASAYQLNDRIWLGIQTGAPYGLSVKPNNSWAGEVYSRSNRIFSLAVNPVIGIKVTDWLSVGAGPLIQYFRLTLRQAVPLTPLFPAGALPSSFIKGDSFGVGFTAGAVITPWAGTRLGLGYRSLVHHDIDGSIGVPLAALAANAGQVRGSLNTPEKISVGITQAITPDFRLNAGFERDNWSRLGTVGIVSKTRGVTIANLPLNYNDGYIYSVGAEYDWSQNLTLRAGVSYDSSPINFVNRSARVPDGDRVGLAAGASYRWSEKLTLNFAYAHTFVEKGRILSGAGRETDVRDALGRSIAFAGISEASADTVSVGFRYVFGDVAPAASVPLIRKN